VDLAQIPRSGADLEKFRQIQSFFWRSLDLVQICGSGGDLWICRRSADLAQI
jgi:hypothetical protein